MGRGKKKIIMESDEKTGSSGNDSNYSSEKKKRKRRNSPNVQNKKQSPNIGVNNQTQRRNSTEGQM